MFYFEDLALELQLPLGIGVITSVSSSGLTRPWPLFTSEKWLKANNQLLDANGSFIHITNVGQISHNTHTNTHLHTPIKNKLIKDATVT